MKLQFIIMNIVNIPVYIAMRISLILLSLILYAAKIIRRLLIFFVFFFIFRVYKWLKCPARESNYLGSANKFIGESLKISFLLFLLSEVIFFFRFFWAYFHFMFIFSERSNTLLILKNIRYKRLAFINTLLLLSRGYSLTNSHSFMFSNFILAKKNLYLTLILGFSFILMQGLEYLCLAITRFIGIFSAVFFTTTGFHGIHVICGLRFLIVIYVKLFNFQKIIFEFAAWYWHFVDIVWLFLFCWFYWVVTI